jgi:VIT1/CCC1 family predicted Fe2+/Mn2+ transporter
MIFRYNGRGKVPNLTSGKFLNFYIAVAKDLDFKKRFWEMTIISMGVAGLSFGIGVLAKMWTGVKI